MKNKILKSIIFKKYSCLIIYISVFMKMIDKVQDKSYHISIVLGAVRLKRGRWVKNPHSPRYCKVDETYNHWIIDLGR